MDVVRVGPSNHRVELPFARGSRGGQCSFPCLRLSPNGPLHCLYYGVAAPGFPSKGYQSSFQGFGTKTAHGQGQDKRRARMNGRPHGFWHHTPPMQPFAPETKRERKRGRRDGERRRDEGGRRGRARRRGGDEHGEERTSERKNNERKWEEVGGVNGRRRYIAANRYIHSTCVLRVHRHASLRMYGRVVADTAMLSVAELLGWLAVASASPSPHIFQCHPAGPRHHGSHNLDPAGMAHLARPKRTSPNSISRHRTLQSAQNTPAWPNPAASPPWERKSPRERRPPSEPSGKKANWLRQKEGCRSNSSFPTLHVESHHPSWPTALVWCCPRPPLMGYCDQVLSPRPLPNPTHKTSPPTVPSNCSPRTMSMAAVKTSPLQSSASPASSPEQAQPVQKRKGGRKPVYATQEERKMRNRAAQAGRLLLYTQNFRNPIVILQLLCVMKTLAVQ